MICALSAVDWFELIVFIFFTVGGNALIINCLVCNIIASRKITAKFDRLKIGMTAKKVKKIMGEPDSEGDEDDTAVWKWSRDVRGGHVSRTAYFRDGVLCSVSRD